MGRSGGGLDRHLGGRIARQYEQGLGEPPVKSSWSPGPMLAGMLAPPANVTTVPPSAADAVPMKYKLAAFVPIER